LLGPPREIEGHTRYSGHGTRNNTDRKAHRQQNRFLLDILKSQVKLMNASNFDIKAYIESRSQLTDNSCEAFDVELDPTAAEVLDTIQSTPLGRLLRMIGSLPEIRHDKVCNIRRQIDYGQYDLSENLDLALDRVLEEFIADT
jgi:negative regulator of flagellin synthesis FlgM